MELPEFDQMVHLAKHRPEEFEALRTALIEEMIASSRQDSQRRLRGLQFQIDMARRKAKTPMAACIRISSLMHDSLAELKNYLNAPLQGGEFETQSSNAANIISMSEFRARNSTAGAV